MSEPEQKAVLGSTSAENGSDPPNDNGRQTISYKNEDKLNCALEVRDVGNELKEEKEVHDVKMTEAVGANPTEGVDSKMAEADVSKNNDVKTEKEGDVDVREEEAVDRNMVVTEDMQKDLIKDVKKVGAEDSKQEFHMAKDVETGGRAVEGEKMEEDTNMRNEEGNGNLEKKNEEKAKASKKKWVRGQKLSEKGHAKKKDGEKKAKEVSTPVPSSVERPVRERKSVDRLVEALEGEPVKPFVVEKGNGTLLKDIPNVAYKLARKKPADLRLLHQILFGRVGKASSYRNHILQFSGFVWHESEDKKKTRIKEKLDKCVKDSLVGFFYLFDLPITRAHARKEELVATLLDFMVAPHATRDVILSENEQSAKSKKRKWVGKGSRSNSSGRLSDKRSRKEITKGDDAQKTKGKESEHETEDEEEDENENGVPSEDDAHKHSENKEDYIESKEDKKNAKGWKEIKSPKREKKAKVASSPKKVTSPKPAKSLVKSSLSEHSKTEDTPKKIKYKEAAAADVKGNDTDNEQSAKERKEIKAPKRVGSDGVKNSEVSASSKKISSSKSAKSAIEVEDRSNGSGKVSSRKKRPSSKFEDKSNGSGKVSSWKKKDAEPPKQKTVVSKTNTKGRENASGKKLIKCRAKSKECDESGPSKDELRKTICKILNKVDFNTATFTDILKELASHYRVDVNPRKAAIKLMIQEEVTKLAEADEVDEEEEEDETEDKDDDE